MNMPSTHSKLVRAAFCAALGCAVAPVEAQQNESRLILDVVSDARLPNDTVWRVTAGARLTTGSWCMFRFLKCLAFAGAEGRVPGTELIATAATFGNISNDKPRNLITDLVSGLRFDLADTRGEIHGPWYVQLKVARRGMEIRSSVPIPRRNMATLAVGVDF